MILTWSTKIVVLGLLNLRIVKINESNTLDTKREEK
jgi:hypothetical protein